MIPTDQARQECIRQGIDHARSWIENAPHRAVITYHEGYLPDDRLSDPVAQGTMEAFYAAQLAGLVCLTQRRATDQPDDPCAARIYLYLATRTNQRKALAS